MSKTLIGTILIVAGIAAFHLIGSRPSTPPVWQNQIPAKIYSEPVMAGDNYVFMAGDKGKRVFKLHSIDGNGKHVAESVRMTMLPFSPVVFDKMIVLGDYAKVIRGFSLPDLKIAWETGTVEPFKMAPLKIDEENFLIQSSQNSLFCLNSQTGEAVWDKTFTDALVNYAADDVIICLHGFKDLKTPQWKATAISKNDGSTLWTMKEALSSDDPLFVQGLCILTSNEGEILVIEQETGSMRYKHPVKGLKAVQVIDETLIMLASGGSRLICMSLMTGNSWATTMQSGFTGAARYENKLLVADKKNLRCLDLQTGALLWHRNLEDIYNVFPFKKGVFITHKDSFFSRNTFGSYIETSSPESVWMHSGQSLFMKPMATPHGDLLLAYNGEFAMLPAKNSTAPKEADFKAAEADPFDKIIFWKDRTASGTTDGKSLKTGNNSIASDDNVFPGAAFPTDNN